MTGSKRYYSNLHCVTCSKDMEENKDGSFKCPNCLIEIGVLR